MKEYIAKVAEGENLTEEEAKGAMDIMLSGDATQAQIAAFLALERVKGETLDELAGFAVVLRDKAETIFDYGIDSIMTTINGAMDIEEALERAEELYISAADRTFLSLIHI